MISIHAPVKGATRPFLLHWDAPGYFNPRTREGCDKLKALSSFDFTLFQSTHP